MVNGEAPDSAGFPLKTEGAALLLEAEAGQEWGLSVHLWVPLPTSGLPPNQPSAGQSGCPKAVQPRMKLMGHSHNFLLPVNSCGVWSPPAPRRQSHSAHGLHWPPFPSSHSLYPTLLLGGGFTSERASPSSTQAMHQGTPNCCACNTTQQQDWSHYQQK